MRDILLIILLCCICLRACDNNNFSNERKMNFNTCKIEMIKGHEYIVCRDVFSGVSIIHAESCSCKKQKGE